MARSFARCLQFDAQDTRELKGVPGAWELFDVVR